MAIAQVCQAAQELGWQFGGLTWSPLLGPAGNIEYLLWLQLDSELAFPDQAELLQLTQSAQQALSA
jgi:23S rRNA (cytidine1920-2'-O)/16S rRNA (cytidine1409-2'-O)-methyltransferase